MARAKRLFGYRYYNFVTKDPVIDKLRTIVQDEGFYKKDQRKRLSLLSGVSVSTFDNMFEGETRLPRHTTIAATAASLGYEEQFVKTNRQKINREKSIAQAAEELKAKREKLKRAAARAANGVKRHG